MEKVNLFGMVVLFLKFHINYPLGCLRSKYVSFFDYDKLLSFRGYFSIITDNMLYGHHKIYLKKVLSKSFSYFTFNRNELKKVLIDHGMLFGNAVRESNFEEKHLSFTDYYTFGPRRRSINERWLKLHNITSVRVHSLGVYIKYADSFYGKKRLLSLKKEFGRILLVIPSHTVLGINQEFDENSFLNEIDKVGYNFDTILVCVYWKDILEKKHNVYVERGYKIVCAGYNGDPYFLSRLRDLFWLCDLSMSNQLGTHIGYSITLGRPHYFFYQDHHYSGRVVEEQAFVGKDANKISDIELFKSLFGHFSMHISEPQKQIVAEYWG